MNDDQQKEYEEHFSPDGEYIQYQMENPEMHDQPMKSNTIKPSQGKTVEKKYKFKLLMERVFFMEGKNAEEARYKLLEKMAEERPTFESIGMDYLDDGIEVITKD